MKLHSILVAGAVLLGITSAQLAGLPECAKNCTLGAIPASCGIDPVCICSSTGFIYGISCCVSKACDKADQEKTIKFADAICKPYGITNLPTAATCGPTPAGNGTAASTGTAKMSSGSTMTSTVMSSTPEPSTGSTTAGSTAAGTATSAVGASTSSTPSATPNVAAGFWAQGLGVVGAAAVGAVALM